MKDATGHGYDLAALCADLAGIEHSRDPEIIARKSRDFYRVSPILTQMLKDKRADVFVSPADTAELAKVVRAAVRHRVPITLRAKGSANYGQSVPLKGGIVLDTLKLAGPAEIGATSVRVGAGKLVQELRMELRAAGKELRFFPTTAKYASIGGHFAGGQGGPGSVSWGTWADPGNILSCTVMTVEAEPRLLELRGLDAQLAHHTYGATGIITEMELPILAAQDWREAVVVFPDHADAVAFGIALAQSPSIDRQLCSVHEWPTPALVDELAPLVPEGHSMVLTMIAAPMWETFAQMVERAGGRIACEAAEGEGPYGLPIWQFSFGHMLYQIQRAHPGRAVIEGFFRGPDLPALVGRVHEAVKDYGPLRLELLRIGGELVGTGSPYFTYESPDQMAAMVTAMQGAGAIVSNSHSSNVRSVGKKRITARDLAFKREVDPFGLLNPGRFEADESLDAAYDIHLPTDSWHKRLD